MALIAALCLAVLAVAADGKGAPPAAVLAAPATGPSGSLACGECHKPQYQAWSGGGHALANRPLGEAERAALRSFPQPGVDVAYALGHRIFWQPLVRLPGNRLQAHELAYDVGQRQWFNVFGNEGRQAGEWGHWTGRGMNWNSMCAQCHMTQFAKDYDPASDSYHSTWSEHGVGCVQCHGQAAPGHGSAKVTVDRQRAADTCLSCHTRAEPLTAGFHAGDLFDDHFRMTLPSQRGAFYPDGQQRDEVFTGTSLRLSRMGHAGVTCLDCHDPHSGGTVLPTAGNQLCLQCHAAPGRVLASGTRAVPIDPQAHAHHAPTSAGFDCVACHMPTTDYMQRSPRHDHGFLRPDPLLTREAGIPNACNRCHADKSVDWAIEATNHWYGAAMESRQRARTRAVVACENAAADAQDKVLKVLASEDIPEWRATFLDLLEPWASGPQALAAARSSLGSTNPVERAAAVRLLGVVPGALDTNSSLVRDPSRLVRLEACWALSATLKEGSAERAQLDQYLALGEDQPAGRARRAQDLANRGRLDDALVEAKVAAGWDPHSPGLEETQGLIQRALGRDGDAANSFTLASDLAKDDADLAFRAGLAKAQAGDPDAAMGLLRRAVEARPSFARAWYDLGLLENQRGAVPEAIASLRKAQACDPACADYPFAAATILARTGRLPEAREAIRRVEQLDPRYPGLAEVKASLR